MLIVISVRIVIIFRQSGAWERYGGNGESASVSLTILLLDT